MSDFDRLLSLADALARGGPLDPDGASTAPQGEAREKHWSPDDLEKLIDVLRRIDQTGPEAAESLSEPAGRSPGRWAHLAILSTIGTGAFGKIYRAHDPRIGLDVALELLSPSEPAESIRRFLESGRRLIRLRHPNVIRCYGVDEWAGCAGMWTELVRGQTLEELVQSHGPLTEVEATIVGRAMCHAAAVIHQAGLPHADVTPRNVVRDASGRVVLIQPASPPNGDRTTATVIHAIGTVISFLVTAHNDAASPEIGVPLASVIEQAISSNTGRGFTTFDAFDSALARALPPAAKAPPATTAARTWIERIFGAYLLRGR
jgi:protein kinase-like protein